MSARPVTGHRRLNLITGLTAIGTTAAAVTPAVPAEAAVPAWRVVKTYDHSAYDALHGVTATGSKDAWAFGDTDDGFLARSRPVASRWNGRAWTITALPAGLTGVLRDGDHSSASNVWAIGGDDVAQSYVLRWNGKRWSVAKRWDGPRLTDIEVIGPKDVWVFGSVGQEGDGGVGTWHYNGRTWKHLVLPFDAMTASKVSGKNIWAIGDRDGGARRTVGHWNGRKWSIVSTGTAVPRDIWSGEGRPWRRTRLTGILARSAKDVWISGSVTSGTGAPSDAGTSTALLAHWNGRSWRRVAAPGAEYLTDITPDGRGGLWFTTSKPFNERALQGVLRHRAAGGKWSTATVSGLGERVPYYHDLALVPGSSQLFGVGHLRARDGSGHDGMIIRRG